MRFLMQMAEQFSYELLLESFPFFKTTSLFAEYHSTLHEKLL